MNDPRLEANIFYVAKLALSIHDVEIISDEGAFLLLNDRTANIFYILVFRDCVNVDPLMEIALRYQKTVAVASLEKLVLGDYGFPHHRTTRQFTFEGSPLPVDTSSYSIEDVTMDDLPYILDHYLRIGEDDEYIKNAISRGMIKAVGEDGQTMGFIGEHPEHTLGMLYVDENHRRKGIGRNLEYAMINRFLKLGKRPLDHVVVDNQKSNGLQSSIPGMKLDDGYFEWFF